MQTSLMRAGTEFSTTSFSSSMRHVQTGSYNYAASSNKNSENVLVVWNDPPLAATYLQHWESRFKESSLKLALMPLAGGAGGGVQTIATQNGVCVACDGYRLSAFLPPPGGSPAAGTPAPGPRLWRPTSAPSA